MPRENDFSSTMRIDIPPDILTDQRQKTDRLDTAKFKTRVNTARINRNDTLGNSKFEQLLQSMYDAAIITDQQGQILDGNVRASEFLLYSRAELKDLSIIDIISGADASLISNLCQNLKNEKFALLQAYCIRQDHSYFPAEIAVNLLKLEDSRLCFFVRDVTLRRQAEEMLRTEHNAMQNSGNGIAIANVAAKLEYVNPAVLNLWGYSRTEELLGKDLRTLITEEGVADKMVQAVISYHESWTAESVAKRSDGSQFHVQISAACNRDNDGEVVGMVLSFVDISDRKRAEEALRQTERQRVMLASVGAACHHLGQPATVIMTNLELIRRMTARLKDKNLDEILKLTNEAAESLADVLHKLNSVNEYRTVQYLDTESSESPENVILDI